ncbi:hypothetical protein LXA43DRAFT_1091632 [Ganoderma leucocontextum]|nr:hypothetical protein LXA43DRAFT_1091632 [Ganoderma leucocontextum]
MAHRRRRRPPLPQYYDDSGAPIDGGCRHGGDCYFVHPSQAQWASARPSRNPNRDQGFQTFRERNGGRDRDREADYGRRERDRDGRDRGGDPGRGFGHAGAGAGTSMNAIPTGPRKQKWSAGAGASPPASSVWGKEPIAGSAWEERDAQAGTNTTAGAGPSASTNAQASSSSTAAAADWGTSENDWGSVGNIPWGAGGSSPLREPVAGGWELGSPNKAPERKDSTRSSFAEPAPKDKGKAREVVMGSPVALSPQVGFHTLQLDFATPRTPRSPNRSPQDPRVSQDPRRKPSIAGAPTDNHMRREREGMRMSSLGVPVPIANAGPEGASSSKPNPFAFPEYTPAENMDVSRNEPEPGQVQEDQPVHNEDIDMVAQPARAESPVPQDQALSVTLESKWKDFTRTLSKAVSLQLELKALEESREKQRKMHRSKAYQSASLVGVHKTFEELHKATDDKISQARKQLNRCLDKLMRYPLDGLPVPSQDDTREAELEQVRVYVTQIQGWLEEIRPMVEKRQETYQQAEEQRQQVEEEQKKAAEEAEARAKAQLNKAKWAPITSERVLMAELRALAEDLDDRATDLEEGMDELRNESASAAEVVSRVLEERGYQKQSGLDAPRISQTPSEEGEVRPERPAPPRSYEELLEDVTKLKKRFKKANREFVESAEKFERHEQSTLARKRDYHELARDNANLNLKVQELVDARKQDSQRCASNEKALADLRALLDRHGASLPAPPPPPPTAEEIAEKLKSELMFELLPVVERALNRLKGGVEESMRDSEETICKQLFTILQPAVAMVDTVKPVLDRHPTPDTPAALAHTQATVLMPPPPPPVQTAQHS